jgi:hypothetical protein
MASYNCIDSTDNAYGSGSFGTCTGQSVGAPNTGVFEQVVSSGTFTVLLPFVVAVVFACVAALLIRRASTRRRRDR